MFSQRTHRAEFLKNIKCRIKLAEKVISHGETNPGSAQSRTKCQQV